MTHERGLSARDEAARTVLIVERDAVAASAESRELEDAGFRVLEASGVEAAARLLGGGESVDIVLADASLDPGPLAAARGLPMLFLYSSSDSAAAERVSAFPSYGFVVRGADAVVLAAAVSAALRLFEGRKAIEARAEGLRMERDRLGLAFDGSGAGWWDWKVETGEMTVNERWAGMLGYSVEELGEIGIGTFDRLVHPDDAAQSAEITRKYLAGEIVDHEIQLRMRRKDGGWQWILDKGKATERSPAGAVLRISGVHFDIQAAKAVEARLELVAAKKGELMRELQHRVKNGLNLASSLLRLEMGEVEDEKAKKALHDAVSRLRAMAAIYEKLSRSEDLQSVDLGAYLGDLAESVFRAFVSEDTGLRLSLGIGSLRVDSNRAVYLGLILTELLTNAVKYAYPGGEGEIRVSLELSGGQARLRVADSGAGFSPGFDPEAASSLGLTLVRMLASQIGAELRIEGPPGAGVIVSFGL